METMYDGYVHKLFSSYFHKISKIAYKNHLYKNHLTLFIYCYINILFISTYMINTYVISTYLSCLSKYLKSLNIENSKYNYLPSKHQDPPKQ
jgi:hypothetical protein